MSIKLVYKYWNKQDAVREPKEGRAPSLSGFYLSFGFSYTYATTNLCLPI